ncbi:MAG: hypothetical protein IIC67_10050, partial [Thaumarchaeota archaeon]|nr:hypothetical protein [Nitrososphaerota archaeon]
MKKNGKRSVLFVILLVLLLVSMSSFASADIFIDTTNEDFGNGTLFKTNITGSGAGANVTLNVTTFEFISYETSGNFTSRIFDTTPGVVIFDKIAWSRVLTNSSDVMGYAVDIVADDIGVFYRNGSHGVDTSQTSFTTDVDFTSALHKYTILSDWSRDDIVGFAQDDDVSDTLFAFFRNGSVLQSGDLGTFGFNQDVSLTTANTWSIPSDFNVSDVIGFAINSDNTDSAVFFKNGSYVHANSETVPFTFSVFHAYSLPSDFDANNAIGIAYDRAADDAAMFFRNGSFVSDIVQTAFTTDVVFDTMLAATYHSGFDLVTHTNITMQTRVSNDSITFTPWSRNYTNPDGSESIEDNLARYIQYKAVLETPDKYITPHLEDVSINYTIDTIPPTITIVNPLNNSFVNNGLQKVIFNITDTFSGIDTSSIDSGTFQYSFLGLSPLPVSSITFTPITDGFFVNGTVDLTSNEVEVNITVNNAKDNAGNAIPTVSWSY